jgi:hypothetical protein
MLALSLVIVAAPARAHAASLPDATSVLFGAGYALPIGCSLVTGTYNSAYMVYDEGAPRGWRTAAYVCGGLSIGVGTWVLIDNGGASTGRTVIGILPIVIGAGAVLTAWFVGAPDDVVGNQARLTPWLGEGSGGLVWSGTF